jgi:ABC-type transporter MlaC component
MQLFLKSLVLVGVLAFGFASASATAGREAEQFAGGLLQEVSLILRDNGGEAARADRLHQLVMHNLDARKTALFALGGYQRQADPKIVDEYVAAFTNYITTVYEARLRSFRSFDFKVVNSMDAGQGDTTVITQAKPTVERRGASPVYIWLRLSPAAGRYKITDVQIAGLWVSIHEREKFARILSENHADLRALTNYLNYQAAQIKAGSRQV